MRSSSPPAGIGGVVVFESGPDARRGETGGVEIAEVDTVPLGMVVNIEVVSLRLGGDMEDGRGVDFAMKGEERPEE